MVSIVQQNTYYKSIFLTWHLCKIFFLFFFLLWKMACVDDTPINGKFQKLKHLTLWKMMVNVKFYEKKLDEFKELLDGLVDDLVFIEEWKCNGFCCCHCRRIAIYHNFTNCKHLFCNKCLLNFVNKPCPKCKKTITEVSLIFSKLVNVILVCY